ncbi:MAG: DNRLRE domain-containing protein, partial [Anaerolineales bacterium]
MSRQKNLLHSLALLSLTLAVLSSVTRLPQTTYADSPALLYLPFVLKGTPPERLPRIHAPNFGAGEIAFEQTAIAWFGTLSPDSNYADIRVGYNDQQLYVYLAVFDRHLWYDENPAASRLEQWDAITLLLDTNASPNALSSSSYRFVGQLYGDEDANYRAVYRGSGSVWQLTNLLFGAKPGWRGNALNDNSDSDRGWAMGFTIPFSSLGWTSAPPSGTAWRMAVLLHDRDSRNGAVFPIQTWPPQATDSDPGSWGFLNFGIPSYATTKTPSGSAMIRRPSQNSPLVPDADVGGAIANQCPGDEFHIWNEWANRNYGTAPDFNIQNQADVADWPCFAKYYVTFPLDSIPPGKTIVSATLTLHQFGNAGGSEARRSWIQVLTTLDEWKESTIT